MARHQGSPARLRSAPVVAWSSSVPRSCWPAGGAAADRLFGARRQALGDLLQGFDPEQHADLAAMLTQLSRALLGDDADRQLLSR